MPEIPVEAESPSASVEPRIVHTVDGVLVAWRPERGWICAEHTAQEMPCEHLAGLTVGKHPEWEQ